MRLSYIQNQMHNRIIKNTAAPPTDPATIGVAALKYLLSLAVPV